MFGGYKEFSSKMKLKMHPSGRKKTFIESMFVIFKNRTIFFIKPLRWDYTHFFLVIYERMNERFTTCRMTRKIVSMSACGGEKENRV
jgi:hypothetical protein